MLLTDKKKKIRNLVTNPRTMEIGQTPLKGQWKLDKTPLKGQWKLGIQLH